MWKNIEKLQEKLSTYFPEHLKRVREESGLTKKEMADKLGISLCSYSDLEQGKTDISADTLMIFFTLCKDQDAIRIVREFFKEIPQEQTEV